MACAVVEIATGIILNMIVADCTNDKPPKGAFLAEIPFGQSIDQQWIWETGKGFKSPIFYILVDTLGRVQGIKRMRAIDPIPDAPRGMKYVVGSPTIDERYIWSETTSQWITPITPAQ